MVSPEGRGVSFCGWGGGEVGRRGRAGTERGNLGGKEGFSHILYVERVDGKMFWGGDQVLGVSESMGSVFIYIKRRRKRLRKNR